MREGGVIALTIVVLGICLLVNRAGDSQTLVPAPEAVAEGLVKQLAAHRYEQTSQLLSPSARFTITQEEMASWIRAVEEETGAPLRANGVDSAIHGDVATARVEVAGPLRSLTVRLALARESGLWRVTRLPAARP
jgi:hypothetical protein